MKIQDFYYDLPEHLIAQKPIEPRDNSKLLILDKSNSLLEEKHFFDIYEYL
jgi:S-adenosylmethionine:tRNA ribosyltransferase-isomerase